MTGLCGCHRDFVQVEDGDFVPWGATLSGDPAVVISILDPP